MMEKQLVIESARLKLLESKFLRKPEISKENQDSEESEAVSKSHGRGTHHEEEPNCPNDHSSLLSYIERLESECKILQEENKALKKRLAFLDVIHQFKETWSSITHIPDQQ